jgi:hypothetical protein
VDCAKNIGHSAEDGHIKNDRKNREMDSLSSIENLLPNPQLLNFYAGIPSLPTNLPQKLKLIMGAGDLDQDPEHLNVKYFSMFDVFYCEPWDNHGSLRKNVVYLLANYPNKVICFLDHTNPEHRAQFCELFQNRFEYIDGYLGHTPHFTARELAILLAPGGQAVNIEDTSEMVVKENAIYNLVSHTYGRPLSYEEIASIRGPLFLWSNADDQLQIYFQHLFGKFWKEAYQYRTKFRTVGSIDDMFGTDLKAKLRRMIELYFIFKKFVPTLPADLVLEYKPFKRIWHPETTYEFVITKKSSFGGRRKRKSKTTKRKRRGTHRK